MGLLMKVLAAPVTGPVNGFTWIAKKLAEKVESEVFDPKKIQKELEDLQMKFDLGQITEDQLEQGETLLLERLKAIRDARQKD